MPTYEYQCKACGKHHDVVQKFGDDSLTECPSCGGPLRKVFGAVGVVFKGSGFYKTDSRAAAKKSNKPEKSEKPDKADTKVAASSDTGSSSSSDSSVSKSSDAAGSGSSSKKEAKTATGSAAAAS